MVKNMAEYRKNRAGRKARRWAVHAS